jgi:filamentous hemagglutinin family protein
MSNHSLATKSLNANLKSLLKRGTQIGLSVSAFTPMLALANPTGGQVIAGSAAITNPNANNTVVKQTSASAIIDWQQFNIGKGQYVQFLQPSSSSIILNRVIGGGGSSIFGTLTGNGQVFLVNTNGVFFGKGSSIDAQGFLASTLDIADSDFLNGHFAFNKTGSDATVVNQGSITAHKGGYVVLAGDYTENDGLISAQSGHIVLASGSKSTLTLNGNSLVSYAVNQATLSQLAGVANAGKLNADGGTVIMTADVANLLKATVVNNTGLIEARAISKNGGVIQLLASGGNIVNAGTLDASAAHSGIQGGAITLKGDERTTLTDTSKIVATGDGANGGHVEVSGDTLSMRGTLSLGKKGSLLLDPSELQLVTGSGNNPGVASNTSSVGHVGVGFIQTQLNSGASVILQATNLIDASANVHAISATGVLAGNGHLTLTTGGRINLQGVDINIGGRLTANMGYGTFGHLTAGSMDLHASSHGHITLPKATVTSGAVTTWSAKTTVGDLSINAGSLQMLDFSASATLALSAKNQLGLIATYGDNSHERLGNVTLAGASMRVHPSIHITGKFKATASAGYADFSNVIADKGINITTTNGNLDVGDLSVTAASGSGVNLTAAGGSLVAGKIDAGYGNVTLADTATGRDVRVKSIDATHGSVTVNANTNQLQFGSSAASSGGVTAQKGITLTASGITNGGNLTHDTFTLQGGSGDITVHGAIGASGSSEHVGAGGVTMITTGNISLDHKVDVFGAVDIEGKSLNYTGAGSLEIIAIGGIKMDASIGTAKAPVAYDVQLDANSGFIDIQRSIYTKGSIGISESHQTIGLGAGVHVGNGDSTAITLSAKGPISIKGARVDIGADHGSGHDATITISADDGNSKTSTDKLSITASNGSVYIQPSGNAIHDGTVAKATLDHSITLHAGDDVSINAAFGQVSIRGAGGSTSPSSFGMRAFGRGANTSISALGDVNITAGHDIKVTGTGVDVLAGFTRANVNGDTKAVANATAAADVNFTAGHDIDLTATGGNVTVAGGKAYGFANAGTKGQKITAKASATTTFNAGNEIDLSGSSVSVLAGNFVGTGSGVFVGASGAVANVSLAADVKLNAGNDLKVTGNFITLEAGRDAGGAAVSSSPIPGGSSFLHLTRIIAGAKGAVANETVSAGIAITAGKGGASLDAVDGLSIKGGNSAGAAVILDASSATAHVSDTITANVSIASKGDLTLKGNGVSIGGGASAARSLTGGTSSGSALSHHTQVLGRGDTVVNLNIDSGVTLDATGAFTLTATHNADVDGGVFTGVGMEVSNGATGTKGSTKVALQSGVDIDAGSALSITAKSISLQGGDELARGLHIDAQGGTIGFTAGAGLSVTGQSVALHSSATSGAMSITGGSGSSNIRVTAGNAAKANAALDASVSVTATKGSITISGHGLNAHGGDQDGRGVNVTASNGATATFDQDAALNFKATGAFTAEMLSSISIRGGQSDLHAAEAHAQAGGAVASLTGEDSANITAASAKLTGTNIILSGGFGASASRATFMGIPTNITNRASAGATGKATANLKQSSALNLAVTGALSISASHDIALHGAALSNGYGASAFATGVHAVAGVSIDGSLNIKAGSVTVGAGSSLIVGGEHRDNYATRATAGQAGNASLTEKSAVTITATKALTLAGGHLTLGQIISAGYGEASAHSAATANLSGSDGVNLKGASVALSADDGSLLISDGGDVGRNALARANSKSKASLSENAGVSITATTAFSATLSGSASAAGLAITGGNSAGSGTAQGANGGIAKSVINAGVAINVTGATGTVTITDTDTASGGFMNILGGNNAGRHAEAFGSSGAGSVAVTAGVSIAAKGAVTITGQANGMLVGAGSGAGVSGEARANGPGGKAVSNLGAAVSISGGTLSLTDTTATIAVHGGFRLGSVGHAVAASFSDEATGPATATATVSSGVSLTAKSGLSINALGIRLGTDASGASLADQARVIGSFGGKASLTADAGINLSGANVTLQGGAIMLFGQNKAGAHAQVHGGSNGGNAKLTATAGVNVKATSTVNLAATGAIDLFGGVSVGDDAEVQASGSRAVATFTAQSAVGISAKTVTITAAGSFNVAGGGAAAVGLEGSASSGGATTISIASQVSVTATGALTVSATGGHIQGGGAAAVATGLDADHGKLSLAVTAGTALTAGGNLSLNMGGGSLLLSAGHPGSGQDIFAGPAGTISDKVDASLLLKSGAKLTLSNVAGLTVDAGVFGSSVLSSVDINGTGKLSGLMDASVSILGKSVATTTVTGFTHNSATGLTKEGVVLKTGITVSGGLTKLNVKAPVALGTIQDGALLMSVEPVLGAAMPAGQSTSFMPAPAALGGAACQVTLLRDAGHCIVQR